jgi:hypothetical protein
LFGFFIVIKGYRNSSEKAVNYFIIKMGGIAVYFIIKMGGIAVYPTTSQAIVMWEE